LFISTSVLSPSLTSFSLRCRTRVWTSISNAVRKSSPPGLEPKLVSGDLYLRGTLRDQVVIDALAALARRGVGLRAVEQQTARLEDAFVELTKEPT